MSLDTHPQGAHGGRRDRPAPSFWASPAGWVCLGFIGVGGYFLVTEHAAHLAGILPWLLIAACPVMHLFMHHGGHGGHNHQSSGPGARPEDKP